MSVAERPARDYRDRIVEWWSIEVIDGEFAASLWADAHGDALVRSAIDHGATDWNRHPHSWGVVLEFAFPDEAAWQRFRDETVVRAALDAAPDPVHGVIIARGRGGSAGTWEPRRPRPLAGAGAAALPLPHDDVIVDHRRAGVLIPA
jgi:hypothetical protein